MSKSPGPAADDQSQSEKNQRLIWRFVPLAVIAAGMAIGYGFGLYHYLTLGYLAESRETLKSYVDKNYFVALAAFAAFYIVCASLAFPVTSVLTIFGGLLFGLWVGGAVSAIAATAGATVLFLAARSAFADFLRKRVGGVAKRLADGFRDDAFSYLLVLRLAPIFPFVVVNIASALLGVRLRIYVMATALGILPAVFAYAYLGHGVDSVLRAAQASGSEVTISDLVTKEITFAFIGLAVVALIPTVVRKFRGNKK